MKKNIIKSLVILVLGLTSTIALGQNKPISVKDSTIAISSISFFGGYSMPGGEMQKLYGNSGIAGVGYSYKTASNWLFSFDLGFIFGDNIKNDSIFDDFINSDGNITGVTGLVSSLKTYERGYTFGFKAGKILPVFGPNPNSGILLSGGVGFLQHKIRIEDQFVEVPLVSDDNYKQGYDRLTNGLSLSQFVGYQYYGNKRRINFYGGVEFIQGYTKNRRAANYDTGQTNFDYGWDFLTSVKLGFCFAIYKQAPQEYYYH